jgi:hypothetical protein
MQVGTTTIASAVALTANYALMEDELLAVTGASGAKWLQLYGETQTTLDITYTTGAAETSNYVEFYIQFGSGAPALVSWADETMEYFDDSTNQIVLETYTYRIDGASAGTAYTKRIQLPVCTKGIRIYAKEVGVAANYGTLTIKANTQSAGAASYNRNLQTVILEPSADSGVYQDDAVFTPGTSYVVSSGYLADESSPDSVNEGDVGIARMTLDRKQIIAGTFAEDAAHTTGDYGVMLLAVRNDSGTALAGTTGDYIPITTDSNGNLRVATGSGGSAGGGNNTYSTEQGDFTATPTDSTYSIVLSVDSIGGQAITAANLANGILKIMDVSLTPDEYKTVTLDKFTWTAATKTIDITNCTGAFTLGTGDVISLTLTGPDKMRDSGTDAQRTSPIRDLSDQHVSREEVVNTTNVATGTYYYGTMDGYEDLSFAGTLIDGAGETTTLTLDVSNVGGTTAADWMQVYFRDDKNNTNVNSMAATNETKYFACSAPGIGSFSDYRYLITTSASTNTVKITQKRKF